jgi:GDP-4-dehydro-6-deoxy-D-mannose reductase
MPSSPDRPVLVTGAAGFVGGHLLDLLEEQRLPVVAWRRPGEPLPAPPTGASCQWSTLDILDAAAVRDGVKALRPSAVYHLAGAAHAGQSWERSTVTLRTNVLGTHNVLSALAAAGAADCPVLIPGSALVYAVQDRAIAETDAIAPRSPYALSKLAQELCGARAADELGLCMVLTRSFNHIGPRQAPSFFASSFARQVALIEQGRAEPVLRVGNLDARRDLMDVRDTVRAYAALVRRADAGRVYNVCSGTAHRVGDVLDGLLSRSTVAIEVRAEPSLLRPHDAPIVLGDRSRLTADTGWEPRIPMTQTLDDLLAHWRTSVRMAPIV